MSLEIPGIENPSVYTQDAIWRAYEASLSCHTDKDLAVALGVTEDRLREWKQNHPPFYRAILAARARAGDSKAGSLALSNHIANQLPDDLRDLWDELQDTNKPSNAVMMSLATKGDYDKQRLLLHAMASTNFDLSKCMRMLNISKATMDRWAREDQRFVKLWEEVTHAKKSWIESKLIDLVDSGDTRAILFANERVNRDTYGPPTQKIEGTINHNHKVALLDLNKLQLDATVKMAILDAVKAAGMLDLDGLIESDPLKPKYLEGSVE